MRVTNSSLYRNYTSSVNDVHSKLNKSMNKVSSGKAYESAAENPLAYYEGKKIDNQYQDVLGKMTLITDVKHRLFQQESGALSIQKGLAAAKTKVEYIVSDSNNGNISTVDTIKSDLLQKAQSMVNDLNGQYQNYFIYGGNDLSTTPFSLSADGKTLTFSHKFPGDTAATTVSMTLEKQANGDYAYNIDPDDLDIIRRAMKEQGRVDAGYGSISDDDTLIDTFTGGMNLLTGYSSDAMKASSPTTGVTNAMLIERLNNSPIALLGRAAAIMDDYSNGNSSKEDFTTNLNAIMDDMTDTEHTISTVYSDLGNKYAQLETTESKLTDLKLSLTERYKDLLGADPYESITDMYSYQYSYSAALKLGSNLVQASLFDFIR